ncbi:MAG: bifunctional phosphopantothenoylcysteine decarboxylase/phosphopantothenate--cysteine ligase CoaBC [Coriobacteriales bacterium]|jgi:phosphopantothenoylcysteine decarboxylase/phosphopantothenate--cysteine ligase|nr:bifunctional phosphopantothenoylcysteine decarboxylase/phosphopantothenate--cysteine ligase CoaBC [Coriobacteriales bacterium]
MTLAEVEAEAPKMGPTVLLGVTGCVAAYKACEVVRLLQKAGIRVKVVMTPAGAEFVTPTTFRALTHTEVALAPVDDAGAPVHHISLAQEADVFLIAPATANTLNKLAGGIADNLLTTTALATRAPLLVAPAMNVRMWRDETTQASLGRLRERGVAIIEPEAGYLACGEIGEGRLAPVEEIVAWVLEECRRAHDLEGRRILVTAGATREHLDPVRFVSNPSSGRTGYAIAEEAARRGADVVLVSGPTTLPDPFGCTVVRVTSALEMLAAAEAAFAGGVSGKPDECDRAGETPDECGRAGGAAPLAAAAPHAFDAAIFTAAVADFRPANPQEHKLKKGEQEGGLTLHLVPNPDILKTLAQNRGGALIVGFAAETREVVASAQRKLHEKGADLIVANDVSSAALGFASTHNRWHFVADTGVETTDVLHKRTLACLLLDRLTRALAAR